MQLNQHNHVSIFFSVSTQKLILTQSQTRVLTKDHKSCWSLAATLITGSLSMDSRVLDEVVKVVRADKEVSGGGMGSELMML